MGACFDCHRVSPEVELYANVIDQAKKYVKEKKVSVAILRIGRGFEISESISGPVIEVLLYDPHTSP